MLGPVRIRADVLKSPLIRSRSGGTYPILQPTACADGFAGLSGAALAGAARATVEKTAAAASTELATLVRIEVITFLPCWSQTSHRWRQSGRQGPYSLNTTRVHRAPTNGGAAPFPRSATPLPGGLVSASSTAVRTQSHDASGPAATPDTPAMNRWGRSPSHAWTTLSHRPFLPRWSQFSASPHVGGGCRQCGGPSSSRVP